MALIRNILTIQDISSCDFSCDANGLRIKNTAYVSNQTGSLLPAVYSAPIDGGIDLKDGAVIIEVFDNAVAYWTVDCDGNYTNTITITRDDCCTYFNNAEGNTSGENPTAPISTQTGSSVGDTLVEKNDDYINYWTWDGTQWVLDFQDPITLLDVNLTHENNTTDFTDGTPVGEQPTTVADAVGDTVIIDHPNGTSHWTWDGTNWVLNFFNDTLDCCTYFNDQEGSNSPEEGTNTTTGVPANANTGDTLVQYYDDYTVFYTYDGTNWVEDFRIPIVETIGDLINVNTSADAPVNDCDLLAWDATNSEWVPMDMTQPLNCAGLTV